jgi:regulator of sigma E protease
MPLILTIIVFLIILAVLVLVHEFGHFIIAKAFGIRVDEFALGFPPKIFSFKKGETEYVINAVPFGGYVKIFGENGEEEGERSFVNKSKWIQVAVLLAGITFNVLFAWVLFSTSFVAGFTAPADSYDSAGIQNVHLAITDISANSPAKNAGLQAGDVITSLQVEGSDKVEGQQLTVEKAQQTIAGSAGKSITVGYTDSGAAKTVSVTAISGVVPNKVAIGIAMDLLGTMRLPIHKAVWQGGKLTFLSTKAIVIGLWNFFKQIFVGHADFSQVSGPVGIVSLVGEASRFGFFYLLSFTALISLNLAVINVLPFPALDGGRIFFVIIEAIKGSAIKPKVANMINTIGFAILLLLMLIVTYKDIAKLFIK